MSRTTPEPPPPPSGRWVPVASPGGLVCAVEFLALNRALTSSRPLNFFFSLLQSIATSCLILPHLAPLHSFWNSTSGKLFYIKLISHMCASGFIQSLVARRHHQLYSLQLLGQHFFPCMVVRAKSSALSSVA